MTASRWITACCFTFVATAVVADNAYPPPTGPYADQNPPTQSNPEWAPDPNQPTPFSNYNPADNYGYPAQPAYAAPQPVYANPQNPDAPVPPSAYGYYDEGQPAAPTAQPQARSGFNPSNVMNNIAQPMQNMFGGRNPGTYNSYQEAPQATQWGAPQGYANPYGGYKQQGYGAAPYGGYGYQPAPGYGNTPGYGGYGYPNQGYDYQTMPQQPPQGYGNPYANYGQPYQQAPGDYYPPAEPAAPQPRYDSGYGYAPHESFEQPQDYAQPDYSSYPPQGYEQLPAYAPAPQGWTEQADKTGSPVGQGWGGAPNAASNPNPGYSPQFAPDMPPQNAPMPDYAPPAMSNQAQQMPVDPAASQGYSVNGHTPVFRPLTEESDAGVQLQAPTE
ncbi:MAG: hypothetical protein C0631_11725 [Sedimenticola sp.]|nr:MAG: hypothetical protein C0631_11725 [Sedimenticola sp.]